MAKKNYHVGADGGPPEMTESPSASQGAGPAPLQDGGAQTVVLKHRSVTVGVIIIDGLSIPYTGVEVPLERAKQIVGIRTAQLQKRGARLGVKPDACDIYFE